MSASPPGAGKPRKAGCLGSGCGLILLAAVVAGGWAYWRITLPGRLAQAAHAKIRPGATFRDVIAAASDYWSATGSECSEGIESFQVFTPARLPRGAISIRRPYVEGRENREDLRFDSKDELLRHFEARPDLRTCRVVAFTFLVTGVPPRTTFKVELGGDGRVVRVSDPRTWD